ncbi:TadE/TadG family type IV pilus assembly protein [Vibrio parahaemolyticus]|uniref:TadE/TadG family type IV pilus assembly protein n=1 Tax=Vibrio parahaemolyticus TaxID=670 RepID=UPI003892425A
MLTNKQKGVASIIFIGLLPVLLAMMCFAIYVAQQTLEHTKMAEASEVASIAVATSPKDTGDENDEYAALVVSKFMGIDNEMVVANVDSVKCNFGDSCYESGKDDTPYTDYSVVSKSTHKAWITNKEYNMEPEFKVVGSSVIRKSREMPADTYFIFDWGNKNNENPKGKQVALDAIEKVVQDYSHTVSGEENRYSFIPYYRHVISDTTCGTGFSQFSDCEPQVQINGREWNQRYAFEFWKDSDLYTVGSVFSNPKDFVVGQISPLKSGEDPVSITTKNDEFIEDEAYYRPIYPTSDIDSFISDVKGLRKKNHGSLKPNSESWNGLIGAARLSNSANIINPVQHFILFTYGRDNKQITNIGALGRTGLCDVIKDKIEERTNNHKVKTQVTLDVIGLDAYKDFFNGTYEDCFGKDHVFVYQQFSEESSIYIKLSEIINGLKPLSMY